MSLGVVIQGITHIRTNNHSHCQSSFCPDEWKIQGCTNIKPISKPQSPSHQVTRKDTSSSHSHVAQFQAPFSP